jgi:ABC-type multidrug transport system fused ATPase/permease subunit
MLYRAPKNGITAIVGAVGSGKSSLLGALTAEMKRLSGSVTFSGSVGYCPQQAWIMNATVRENILFGREFDADRYWKVVKAACLEPDFKILPDGDRSEIGEKGINLSGGQKQRVSLARLMYTNCDIALFDDPLSAVDSNVGRSIFEAGICGLLAGKTRILVTHALHFVKHCDWVVVMRDGEIAEQGTFEELMRDGDEFSKLMIAFGGESERSKEGDEDEKNALEDLQCVTPVQEEAKKNQDAVSLKSLASVVSDVATEKTILDNGNDAVVPTHRQMQKENQATGKIENTVIVEYFNNYGGMWFVFLIVVALILTQATRLANDLWLISWIQGAYPDLSRDGYMGIYASLGVAQAFSLLFYSALFAVGGIHAARILHEKVLNRVTGSAVGFFDQTPLGRVVNRLSRDIDYADNAIYDALRLLFYSLLQLLAAFGLVAYFTNGLFLVVLIPMLGVYYFVQAVYRKSSRELKRIESVSRSPLYAHISESISGLPTIRAYGEQIRFTERVERMIDANSSPQYLLYTGQRWIQLRLETVGNLLVFSVALFAAGNRVSLNFFAYFESPLIYVGSRTNSLRLAFF